MFGKDPKIVLAEEAEKEAQRLENYSKDKFHGPTQGQISEAYKEAGDLWKAVRNPYRAIENYSVAIKYAYNEGKRRLLKHKIEKLNPKEKGLARILKSKFVAAFAIMCFLGALFFISFNLTGFVIGSLEYNNSNLISVGLFLLGLVFAFFYFRKK